MDKQLKLFEFESILREITMKYAAEGVSTFDILGVMETIKFECLANILEATKKENKEA